MGISRIAAMASAAAIPLMAATSIQSQEGRRAWPVAIDIASATTGSTEEENILLLQLAGHAPLIHTTIRSFSLRALHDLTTRARTPRIGATPPALWFDWMRPRVATWFNPGLPPEASGAVWVGSGLTSAASLGAVSKLGPLSIALRPVAFWSENRAFTPPLGASPNGPAPPYQEYIDLPYRFGDRPYARVDPGESWVQLDTRLLVAGISTATQVWGPMHVYPLLLGPNAGGFPHVLLGTGLPWNVGAGRLSGRMAVGRLDPSAFAPPHPGDPRRLASELVAVFTPRGLDGLELGAGRFFHRRWPSGGINSSVLGIPLEGFLKDELGAKDADSSAADNQLASVFFRLALPASGLEVYGEFLRDDHNYDLNDIVGEPDHESAYALGFRRLWGGSVGGPMSSLTLELVNGRVSHVAQRRAQSPMYIHGQLVEGHTLRGKLLAAPAAFGGSGLALMWRRMRLGGEWGVAVRSESMAHNEEGGRWNGSHVGFHALELGYLRRTRAGEWSLGASGRFGWNALSGGNTVGFTARFRPGDTRP